MAFIRKRSPWTSQPQEAVQFRADLVDQLGIYAGFINPQVAWLSGVAYSPSGIAPSPTQTGLAISNTTGTAVATYPFSGSPESSELTVIMHAVRYGAQPDSGFGTALYSPKLSGIQDPFDWFIKDAGERVRLNTTTTDGSGQYWETTENWPVGQWQTAAFTWRSGSHPDLYRGGRKLSRSVTSDTAPSGVLKPGGVLSINLGALRLNGAVAAAIICSKALRDDQIAQYAQDFQSLLQLLAPQSIWVPVSAGGGGGTDYPATSAETVTSTDSCSVLVGFAKSAPESGAAVDARSAVTAFTKATTEAGTALDTSSNVAALTKTATEIGSALDTVSQAAALSKSATESASALDAVNGTASGEYVGTVTESASAIDVASTAASLSAAATESAASADTASHVASLSATATNSASAADSIAASKAVAALIAEAMSAVESVNASSTGDYFGAVLETGYALDSVIQVSAFFPSVSESALAIDSAVVFNQWFVSIGESATAAEFTSQVLNAILSHSVWWMYVVPADDLTYVVPADDLTYRIGV